MFICCRTVSLHQAGDLTCWIAIFRFSDLGREVEVEVETLYLTAGIIIFDTLVPRAFQKYTTCTVFKAVQLYKKSAT